MSSSNNISGVTGISGHRGVPGHGLVGNLSVSSNVYTNHIQTADGTDGISIDGFISTSKISKILKILCEGEESKVKMIIESDIDRELSSNLIESSSLNEDYLLHLFKIYLKSYPSVSSPGTSDSLEIFTTIARKISKRSYLTKCENILNESSLSISHPTVHALIKRNINQVRDEIPNSLDFIKEE